MNYTFKKGDMTHFIVLTSIGDNYSKIDNMKPLIINNDDWTMDIELKVNGVELDFGRFIRRLSENYESSIHASAIEMVNTKFEDVIKTLHDVQETITGITSD